MLVLASASPRRADLLHQIRVPFRVHPADIDETAICGELPAAYVARLAEQKARTVFNQISDAPVLGSDTCVVSKGQIFGKPESEADYLRMISALSGSSHEVFSAVTVLDASRCVSAISVTEVHFRELTEAERINYWQTGEPLGKAGGYAIQGIASAYVTKIVGSYSGVMGLPLYETAEILRQFDVFPDHP